MLIGRPLASCRWALGALHTLPAHGPQSASMLELLGFISSLITLYIYIIIAGAVMSWLMAFNVVNAYNPLVRSIWQALNALTEPLLRPIRRWMPDLGGIHVPPVVPVLAVGAVRRDPQLCQALRVTPPLTQPWRVDPEGLRVLVRASPKSSREGIAGVVATVQGPALWVRVHAAAQKGEANRAVELAVA